MTDSPDSGQVADAKMGFWNQRAELGERSGTDDVNLKRLELEFVVSRVPAESHVLDIGCGVGATLIQLVAEKGISGVGVDFAQRMVEASAAAAREAGLEDALSFQLGKVPGLMAGLGEFDVVLTERSLINLDDEPEQHEAFNDIMTHLRPHGTFIMIESSVQGLERTNQLRLSLGLDRIEAPWHNTFFDEKTVASWETQEWRLRELVPFTSTYHFLSRVVYAKLATDRGEELKYDSHINQLACRLPPIGDFGPVRAWVWDKV